MYHIVEDEETHICDFTFFILLRVLHIKHLPDCPGASKNQIWASILKDQEITVARIGQVKSVWWTYDFQYEK